MKQGNLVSVIIPCYNVQEYIEACLDSIFSQSYQNLEVIAVDNASSDNTLKILQTYKVTKEQDLIVVQERKRGAPAARNRGLRISSGDWVQFLDADDIILPEKIAHQIALIEHNKDITLIVGSYLKHFINGNSISFKNQITNPWLALPKGQMGITSSNLFRRKELLEIQGWDETRKSSQEYDLMFRLLCTSSEVFYDSKPLTIVREQVNSISNSDILGNNLRRLDFLTEVKHYFLQKGFQQDYIESIEQEIFEELRRLYKLDSNEAMKQYRNAFPTPPKISPSQSTSTLYSKIFNLLGFRAAQSITYFYQSFLKTKFK